MTRADSRVEVYLEVGQKRTFAGAIDWPGWCRGGRDEASALQALLDAGPRFARALRASGLGFQAPAGLSALAVVERLKGNATTDFGAPDAAPARDSSAFREPELKRFRALLEACWQAFDEAVRQVQGRELRKGPRGGRDLDGIIAHVLESDAAYLARLGWKFEAGENTTPQQAMKRARQAALDALEAGLRGEIAARGPRGGLRWTPASFVRRVAWHALDHLWEIEDRLQS
jgi:hypothetical protein